MYLFLSIRLRRVMCTFIMAKQKQKVTVPGLVGWTLLEAAQHHGLLTHCVKADNPWDYATFGEGPAAATLPCPSSSTDTSTPPR